MPVLLMPQRIWLRHTNTNFEASNRILPVAEYLATFEAPDLVADRKLCDVYITEE